jgi:hypothetical protein
VLLQGTQAGLGCSSIQPATCTCSSVLAGDMHQACSDTQWMGANPVLVHKVHKVHKECMSVLCSTCVGTDGSCASLPHAHVRIS